MSVQESLKALICAPLPPEWVLGSPSVVCPMSELLVGKDEPGCCLPGKSSSLSFSGV